MATQLASTRDRRINLRASQHQEALLKQAAQAMDTTLTDFVLGSAVVEAERILADRHWFAATPEQYDAFVELLDRPVDVARLAEFLTEPTPFDRSFELSDE